MQHLSKAVALVALLVGLVSVEANAKTHGILVVGTQAEVREILRGTEIRPEFSVEDANALVAVRLTRGKMTVYEGGVVEDILDFVGGVVEGGVVFTLEMGSKLWELLENGVGVVTEVGGAALEAAKEVLKNTAELVVDGVTFVAKTAMDILKAIADLLPLP